MGGYRQRSKIEKEAYEFVKKSGLKPARGQIYIPVPGTRAPIPITNEADKTTRDNSPYLQSQRLLNLVPRSFVGLGKILPIGQRFDVFLYLFDFSRLPRKLDSAQEWTTKLT